jgi:hypothetical protein
VFLFCFSSSCFSGLSIFDWSFCRLLRLFNANYINCFTHDHYLYFYLRWRDDLDDEKQNKNTTQYVLDTTIRKQTQIT